MNKLPFQKQQSGNAKGRPRQTQEEKDQKAQFQILLRTATIPALQSIIAIASDRRSKDCLAACKFIIDKAYGTDTAFLSDDTEPITIRVVRCDQNNDYVHEKDDNDDWE